MIQSEAEKLTLYVLCLQQIKAAELHDSVSHCRYSVYSELKQRNCMIQSHIVGTLFTAN